jgi:hypothetical protein
MNTQRTFGGIGATVAGLIGLLGATPPVGAQQAPLPTTARAYTTWLARAVDECNPTTITVSAVSPPVPSAGCLQTNVVTDDGVPPGASMTYAKLTVSRTVNHKGKISVSGRGFHSGQRMTVQLTLRVTKPGLKTSVGNPKTVTFEDITVTCPTISNPLGCFTARQNGAVAASVSLVDCLTQNGQPSGLALGNIQILDSALVNCDTGNVIATPGIVN